MKKNYINVAWIRMKKVVRHTKESFLNEVLNDPERNESFLIARAEEDPEKQKKLKEALPCICWNVEEFTDDQRHNESAVSGQFFFTDYDVNDNPHMGNVREYYEKYVRPHEEELHIVEAEETVKHGLHIVAVRPKNATIEQAQAYQARLIGLQHDTVCKDLSRPAVLGHKDEIFQAKWDIIFGEKEPEAYTIPLEGLGKAVSQTITSITQEMIDEVRARPFFGHTLGEVKDALMVETINTVKAPVGKRNWTTYSASRDLQAAGLDSETLVVLFADSGLPEDELRQACRVVPNNQPDNGKLPGRLKRAILQLRQEKGMITGEDLLPCRPRPEKLPTLIRELVAAAPKGFAEAVIILSLPILGFLATNVRVKYLDGVIHSLAFLAHVVGKLAGGKSTLISWLTRLLLSQIRARDAVARQLEREYVEACRKCKNEEKQPEDPKPIIREVPFTISIAALLKRLAQAEGKHLLSVTDEIDTVRKTNKAGAWSEKTDIYRHAFDNGEYGQDFLSENSFSGIYPIMYNMVSGGTEESTSKFYASNVLNGTASRVAFTRIPDDFALEMPKFKELSAKQKLAIEQGIQTLEEAEGEIRLPRTGKVIEQWLDEKRQLARETMSLAIDAFYKRSAVMGYRAAAVAYVLCGYKETSVVTDFGLWVADYVLQQQVAMWGSYIENAEQMVTSTPIANLFAELPEEFTREELKKLRSINGQSTNVRMIILRWKQAGMIQETEPGRYVKKYKQA